MSLKKNNEELDVTVKWPLAQIEHPGNTVVVVSIGDGYSCILTKKVQYTPRDIILLA